MSMRKFAVCGLLFTGLLYAQTDAITVTATKTVDLPPEEVTFNLALLTDQDASLEQVLQAVKDSGIATKDLTGIGTQQFGPNANQIRLVYQFALTVPFSKLKDTLDKFAAVRRSLVASGSSMELQNYFMTIAATGASREQARQKSIPDLIEDARKNGEFLANAAGVSLGPILGITDSSAIGGTAVGGPYGPYGPVSPAILKMVFVLSVRFGIR